MSGAVDLFAGPGGWDEALRRLVGSMPNVGVELDADACATAQAAGHHRLQADVASLDPLEFEALVRLLIGSPPCGGFSAAGQGFGRKDLEMLLSILHTVRLGGMTPEIGIKIAEERQHDERSALVLEPLRWAMALHPEAIALEQVPAVLPVWDAYAAILRQRGYSAWAGKVYAEAYGVPQTRTRAVLIASRVHEVGKPTHTHSRYYPASPEKLDAGVQRWVSMFEALGFGMTERPSMTVTAGGADTGGAEPYGHGARQALASREDWVLRSRRDSDHWVAVGGARMDRRLDQPAPTITGESHRWAFENTVQRSNYSTHGPAGATAAERGRTIRTMDQPSVAITGKPGHWDNGEQRHRITVAEAAVLQSFPADYPFRGRGKGSQYQQVGNAVPPLLAEAVLREALGC